MKLTWKIFKGSLAAMPLFLFILYPGTSVAQTSVKVDVRNYFFSPKQITVYTGDTVVWQNSQGSHNVNGNKSRYPNNPVSFGNTVGTNWTYRFVFTVPGVYDYVCDPHIPMGMTGKVTVLSRPTDPKLTVNFSGMNPHIGQLFTLFVRDAESGEYRDTVILDPIAEATFTLQSDALKKGKSYLIDFYADHNGNRAYDAPPVDHAWRTVIENVQSDVVVDFVHNTNFTDIFGGSSSVAGNLLAAGMRIFPNPVSDQLNIELPQRVGTIRLLVTNLAGSLVSETIAQPVADQVRLPVSALVPGIYFVTVSSGGFSRTLRFVKQL